MSEFDAITEVAELLVEDEAGTEEVKPVENETTEESTDESSESDEESETVETEESGDEVSDETSSESSDEPYTVTTLAKAIEIDPSELYEMMVPISDHGEPISLGSLKDEYTRLTTENPKLTEKVAELEKKAAENKGTFTEAQQVGQDELMAQVEMNTVQKEYQSINWAELEEIDPGEAALKRQKLQERYNNAERYIGFAKQQQETERQTFLTEQYDTLLNIIPEWKDAEVQKTEKAPISKVLLEAGYTQQIVDQLDDPIAFKMLRHYTQLLSEKAASVETLKKVKKAPKILKSSGVRAKASKSKADKSVARAHQTGEMHDKVSAILDMDIF